MTALEKIHRSFKRRFGLNYDRWLIDHNERVLDYQLRIDERLWTKGGIELLDFCRWRYPWLWRGQDDAVFIRDLRRLGVKALDTTYDSTGAPIAGAVAYQMASVTYIVNPTTSYTVPASGQRAVWVQCAGAGAQGGGVATASTNSGGGGGGGGGALSELWKVAPKLTAFTVAVGAGGSSSGTGATTGQVGGDTTFDSPAICTAKGGSGGVGDTIATIHAGGLGGAGGASASGVGDVKFDGSPGQPGLALAAAQAVGGAGGNGPWGQGGAIEKTNATGTGNNGGNYGGGGSGATAISGGASQKGGTGGNGLIRVFEFA